MAVVTMRQLLESGVHFGHQTRRWNPKMKRFIFTERNGIYIIDLQQSLSYIDRAYEFVKETVAHGGTILFVGTKKQAQEPIAEQATRVGMPYVNQRWLGGMLTNFSDRLQAAAAPQGARARSTSTTCAGSGMTKKELLVLEREKDKLDEDPRRHPRHAAACPSAVWIVDTKKEHIAVDEARKLRHPGRRDPRHQLRPGRGRLPDPGQRRRDPLGHAADPRHRRRRRRGPDGPRRRRARRRCRRRAGRRRAAGRVGAGAARSATPPPGCRRRPPRLPTPRPEAAPRRRVEAAPAARHGRGPADRGRTRPPD